MSYPLPPAPFGCSPCPISGKNTGGAKIGQKNRTKKEVIAIDQFALKARHIGAGGSRTTIALEQAFWTTLDSLAHATGETWQQWIDAELEGRPAGIGKARWLRVRLVLAVPAVVSIR